MAFRSLAGRLVAGAAAWLMAAVIIGGLVLADAFRTSIEQSFELRLDALLRAVVAGLNVDANGAVTVIPPMGKPKFDQPISGWYWQVSNGTGLLLRSASLGDHAFHVVHGPKGGGLHKRVAQGPDQNPVLLVERDFSFSALPNNVHVAVAASFAEVEAAATRFNILLGLSLGLLGLGLLGAVVMQVRYGLRPLRRLVGDLDLLRSGGKARLGDDYPQEIAPLVTAMNAVLVHDAALVDRARTHVGNLAHALKTPLAVINSECREEGDPRTIAAQVETMTRLVEHHLARARAASSSGVLGVRAEVAPVVEGLVVTMSKIYADKKLVIEQNIINGPQFPGDPEDLAELIGNMLENACKWARGTICITAELDRGDALLLVVEDDGPGLSAEAAAEASRRGARLDENTPGSGLGLAILNDLVALYGGTTRFDRSRRLGGLRVSVNIPLMGWVDHLPRS